SLPTANYILTFSYLGYDSQKQSISLKSDRVLNVQLHTKPLSGKEVVISAKRKDENVTSTEMGKINLSVNKIKELPALFGEVDILKALQLLPGVQSNEGTAGLYVRGGSPDQNLILLDDAPVYNPGHLFGFFSIFNSDAINNVTLIKGGMPANYGGRLSSVVDVTMKEGNNKSFHGEGGVGLIASRLSIEGPIKKNKSSYIISARRTYVDLLTKPFVPKSSSFHGSGYYFYDLNAKANYIFSDKNRLYLSGYFGRDVFNFVGQGKSFSTNIPWGNATTTIRWNHLFGPKLFSNIMLLYNDYNFDFNATQNNLTIGLHSGIADESLRSDFDYFATPKHHIKFGLIYTYHTFTPSTLSGNSGNNSFNPENAYVKRANEAAIYFLDNWTVSDRLKINAGLRYSIFQQIGPYKMYQEDSEGNKTDSTVYKSFQPVKTYSGLAPRFIVRYELNSTSSLKASITKNYQYVHLVSSNTTTLPTDLWVPSTYKVKPEMAWQYSLGYFRNFQDNMFETSLEVYYKSMQNQIEFAAGYIPSLEDPENSFVFGKGWAYGAELFVHKQRGRLTGWVGYTLSWVWRQFPALNDGVKYPSRFDRRNDIDVVATYQINDKWTVAGDFVFSTGNPITLPERFYFIEGVLSEQYSQLNAYRMKPYNRLDLSAIYTPTPKPGRKFSHSWAFSIYNAYSRLNPYFIYFNQEGDYLNGTLQIQPKKVALFPIIPSVTWNFKF
ncbi:MAG: TonB-dependent receptor, partial [Chitinophagaceae bacterium]